ncbi:MAG TPA: hypothetical protein VK138_07315 [Acidiferrobacterales bacterium]|nr:hypothetical protein [Acidiferrobacterales bacterium]
MEVAAAAVAVATAREEARAVQVGLNFFFLIFYFKSIFSNQLKQPSELAGCGLEPPPASSRFIYDLALLFI